MSKTLFFVEKRCAKTSQVFYGRYDLAAGNHWVETYGVKSMDTSGHSAGSAGDVKIDGYDVGPQYRCPWCGNTAYVRCGRCGKYTCHLSQATSFTCAYCGNSGEISGHFSDMSSSHSGDGQ